MRNRNHTKALGQVFTFFSTASAVGKTCLTANVATYLAQKGFKVCLVNADLQFGDICRYLGANPTNTIYSYVEAMENDKDGFVSIETFLTQTNYDFKILPAPKELDEAYQISVENVIQAVANLKVGYDYIIIDTTTGFTDINVALLEYTDVLLVPCVIDFLPTISNLRIGLDTLEKLQFNINKVHLILNCYKAETQISIKDVEKLLNRNFQYYIANDYMGFRKSIEAMKPIVLTEGSQIVDDIKLMVEQELGAEGENVGIKSWFNKLWK